VIALLIIRHAQAIDQITAIPMEIWDASSGDIAKIDPICDSCPVSST
jgi:hypothetical protein